jgi:hypothetical protein
MGEGRQIGAGVATSGNAVVSSSIATKIVEHAPASSPRRSRSVRHPRVGAYPRDSRCQLDASRGAPSRWAMAHSLGAA